MITQNQVRDLIGSELLDANGNKIGKIGQIFLDDETGQPEWVTVNTGLFGTNESFVPLADAEVTGDALRVSYDKDKVKDAPNVDIDGGHLDEAQEADLYRYYGLEYSDSGLPTGNRPEYGTAMDRGAGRDSSGRNTDEAMTRSEEQVRAGTEKVTAGKARLRKWVETEDVNVSVPVTKEKARLETEPITDANRDSALDGPDISEDEHEVTLSEERPVVAKETVPVERVKLTKDTEQHEEQVSEQVRKERV
ncbi:MAG TPA: PRC and DUF2382 domain-containing protein, partial [Gemmatimonadales bacterium]|nr:PRC and DUF2382 domain-containing protein [Gemmatimonadales bacterium]